MGPTRTFLLTVAALGAAALAGAACVVFGGLYDVAATTPHYQPVHTLLETAMRQSVRLRARDIRPPPLDDAQLVTRGAACYRAKCVQCHGAPGVAQGDIGKSMQPLPGPLVDARQRWHARELYWVTKNGIRMSGMPAWEYRLSDDDLWALVAFLQHLPDMTPPQYAQQAQAGEVTMTAGASSGPTCAAGPRANDGIGDSVRRGQRALSQYACNACHVIPGVTGSSPHVGPSLAGVARRDMIAGQLANTPEHMVRWLRHTHTVDPRTAMPEMGVTEADARDIAAYLATLD